MQYELTLRMEPIKIESEADRERVRYVENQLRPVVRQAGNLKIGDTFKANLIIQIAFTPMLSDPRAFERGIQALKKEQWHFDGGELVEIQRATQTMQSQLARLTSHAELR